MATNISNDNELAGGRFIAKIATPESSCTLLTTNDCCVENDRSTALQVTRCDGRRRDRVMAI